jgi:nucleoid-associated protein YgaU
VKILQITLRDSIDGNFVFPVNPEEIRISREKRYETVSLLSLGEVDFIQGGKVKEIAFSSFFPKFYDDRYCNENIPDPQVAMNRLTALLVQKRPVRLIISGTIINTLVHVTANHSTFKGGEPGDVYFDVTFRTWYDIKVGKTSFSRPDTKPVPKVYVVKSGDSLWAIAKRELGNSKRWSEIYNLNKKVIGPNSNLIKIGQKLVMP